jgi:Tfp pilus assembly protein PilV
MLLPCHHHPARSSAGFTILDVLIAAALLLAAAVFGIASAAVLSLTGGAW